MCAVEVEASARRVQLEPAVEGGQQALAGARRDPRRGLPVTRARVFGARPQPELDQPLVHRDEARHVGAVHRARPQERAEDGRGALDRLQHPPGALARQRMAGRRGELGRDVRHEAVRVLVGLGGCLAGRGGQRETRLAAGLGRVVRDPLAERHHRAQVVVPGPFGQLGGCRSAAGRGQGLPDGEADPAEEHRDQDEDDADHTQPEEPPDPAAATLALEPTAVRARSGVDRPVAALFWPWGGAVRVGRRLIPVRLVWAGLWRVGLVRVGPWRLGIVRLRSVRLWSVRLRSVRGGIAPASATGFRSLHSPTSST